jgi:hypothetical protein
MEDPTSRRLEKVGGVGFVIGAASNHPLGILRQSRKARNLEARKEQDGRNFKLPLAFSSSQGQLHAAECWWKGGQSFARRRPRPSLHRRRRTMSA